MKEKRDKMIPLDRPLQEPLQSDVTAILINLAKLAQRAGTASGDALNDLAHDLLERFLIACSAQQGAIVLMTPEGALAEQPMQRLKDPRLLALHKMREEDMHALLDAFVPTASVMERITGEKLDWITYRLPLVEKQDRQSLYALLLLGWGESAQDRAAIGQGQQVLPLLADAVASVIVTMLQAERLHELEQASTQASLLTMDLFKAELLATVSHELRSPLASIKGYASTLLRHERLLPRDERHQFLLAINEGTNRLEYIVDRLLEMSQLETDALVLNIAPIDVSLLAREAMKVAEEKLPGTLAGRFTFSMLLEDSAGKPAESVPLVAADLRRLREILDNLLENALNYSPEGGAITVVVRPITVDWPLVRGTPPVAKQRRSMLEMCVCDTGIGIAPEHLDLIFDRFYRVDMRLTREVNGLGLGLAMCKRMVELHDGAIWAESLPEGGSVFRVLLPLAISSDE